MIKILNRKNRTVFSLACFIIALVLVGSWTMVTAHDLKETGPTCPAGLVSWWTGDEISGKTVLDIKGKNNGTMVGGVSIVPGKVGNAFKFDGKSGYITMGNPANLNLGTKPFSLEFWIYWDGGPNVNNVLNKAIRSADGSEKGYWLLMGGDHMEFFMGEGIGPNGNLSGRGSTPFTPKTWHHVTAIRRTPANQSGTAANMELIIDGVTRFGRISKNPTTTTDAPFIIGARNDQTGTSEFFSGMIDEISVYDRALDWLNEARPIIKADSAGKCHKLTPTPEPPKSPTPTPSKPPVSPTPTKSPVPQVLSAITYPVADLGSCTSYEDCKTYCSVSANYAKCITYAQKIGLEVEIPDDKKAIFNAMQKGESPGQCKDEASCRNYCEDIDHIEECVSFVEKFKLASSDELKEMRQMADVKKAGVAFPGNCKTKESCLKYCDNSANAVVCMEFALKAGFIPKDEVEVVGRILPYLKSGGKLPGGCTTKQSCDTYCGSVTHTNECVNFAVGAGFMSKEDAEIVKKVGGKSPGNCKSKEACDSYCKDEKHIDECVDFAVKAGFISKEDAEMAKRYKITSGPGGCKGKAECEAFCVTNKDVCFEFAKDHGMLSEEELKNIEEQKKFMSELDKAPPEWLACMEKELGSEFFKRFKAGKITQTEAKSSALEAAQRKCGKEGPDTKECLTKTTCKEFFSCLNPSENKALRQGEGESSDPELKKRTDFCKKESVEIKQKELQEKMDACLALSCGEFDACMKSAQQGDGEQGGQQGEQKQEQGVQDPKITAKVQACQKEKINACLAKSCGEFQACLNSLGGGGGGGGSGGTPDSAVQSKFMTCFPPPPQKSSLMEHSFLGAILRYLFK